MVEYKPDNGLEVLKYLGLGDISRKESVEFREKWWSVYEQRKSLVDTTRILYSQILPFVCGGGDGESLAVSKLRDTDFGYRLSQTGLESELANGATLADILSKGRHKSIDKISLDM